MAKAAIHAALAFGRATQVTKEGRAAEIRKARGKK